ncbi:hypothetical protein ABKV19_014494 [Rosa sericea]
MACSPVVSNPHILEVLDRNNYKHWRSRMKTYLLSEDLWEVVEEPTAAKLEDHDEAEYSKAWAQKNAKALYAIQNSCGRETFSFISEIETAKTAWETLERVSKTIAQWRHVQREDSEIIASEEDNADDFKLYKPFFDQVHTGDWPKAKQCLKLLNVNEAVRVANPSHGNTALHIAAKEGHAHIVKELLLLMTEEDLEIKNARGYTALATAVRKGYGGAANAEVVSDIVKKNKNVLTISLPPHNWFPVVEACSWNRWELARYLYYLTPHEDLMTESRRDGPQILTYSFKHMQGLDIARDIMGRSPILALTKNYDEEVPMFVLVSKPSASFTGTRLKYWQKWIYNGIHIKSIDPINHDVSTNVPKLEDDQGNQRTLNYLVMSSYRGFIMNVLDLLRIKYIYDMKSNHMQILEFLRCMGELTKQQNLTEVQWHMVKTSIFRAVERGNVEFVTEMFKASRNHLGMITSTDEKGRNIFHVAIQYRQENIYSLIYGLRKEKTRNMGCTLSSSNENLLHMAGNLSPLPQFNYIQGAFLQMQRELYWFKEVESIVPNEMQESPNTSDGLTARELFTKNHTQLRKDAEISMKGTSTSCTVVGALIVTIMFAVAFTIPGGSNGNTGLPIFLHRKLFNIFIVSDIISLVSSTTSVVIFLGILTSRYAEDDFHTSLPTKLMIGLLTLFLSISTMMIAFSSALTIMIGDNGDSKTFILNLLLAFLPVTSFVWMQFPLLVEIFISTYGPGIFNKKIKRWGLHSDGEILA